MDFDLAMAFGAFLVAIVVGMTGMGGGALMTPMLVTIFGVPPLTAVSSDLVAAAVMKPVGSVVHLRRGTVNLDLVRWLCIGSIPCAFGGVLIARALGDGQDVQSVIKVALGVALLIAATGLAVRGYLALVDRAAHRVDDRRTAAPGEPAAMAAPHVKARPIPTLIVGAVGGLVVGMSSVGSGSLMIVALLALYPMLRANHLVGTDLVQAVPLVVAAAVGHILFGDFHLDVTAALLAGSIPGVYLGSLVSSRAPGGLVRRALAFVLLASALNMFGLSNAALGLTLAGVLVAVSLIWMLLRKRHGLTAVPTRGEAREPEVAGSDRQ
ncbi:hypothetical protein CLV30_11951 [Haloactinopolyspora alba]|uniref:Probable membrane transporter protein n=1 Tax=Haloactinopolyspora alba TaxID=648780 RepID=A0A2P8DN78_9ACTN|nr:sulfite exporter TauE/SafE family protein [Haloactinopolyspora alba]PSK98668.1 hypothetical protein CLV30_11951 [Haloactinopolyspora alba]